MIDDPEKIMLGNVGFIQEKVIKKGKRSGVLIDIHQIQFSAFLISVLMDELRKLGDFIAKTGKEEQNAQQIDHPDDFRYAQGRSGRSRPLKGHVSGPQFFGGQKRGRDVDEWKDKRQGNGEQQIEPIGPEKCFLTQKNPVDDVKQSQTNTRLDQIEKKVSHFYLSFAFGFPDLSFSGSLPVLRCSYPCPA
jgi:hypothetical protein